MIVFNQFCACFILLLLALASCDIVKTDTVPGTGPIASRGSCEQGAIDYRLPKWKLRVFLVHEVVANPQRYRVEIDPQPIKAADRSQIYCASKMENVASKDQIGIQTENNGLLKRVFTKAEDQSVDIVEKIAQIRAADQIASASDDFRLRGAQATSSTQKMNRFGPYDVDPFNPEHMTLLNNTLSEAGLCLTLEGNNDPFVPYLNLCTSSETAATGHAAASKSSVAIQKSVVSRPLPPEPWGILYRPLLSHTLKVFRKESVNNWQLVQKREVELPNAAPVLAVSVKRAAFAARETDLKFDGGVLYSVDMKKDSELVGFASIPIKVAQVIVGIPAEIIKVRIQSASQNTTLIKANNNLILALAELEKAEAALAETQKLQRNSQSPSQHNSFLLGETFRSLQSANQQLVQNYCLDAASSASARQDCMEGRAQCVTKGATVEECISN